MTQRKCSLSISRISPDERTSPVSPEEGEFAPDQLRRRIAESAYFLAATRDCADRDLGQDWLEAGIMVNAQLRKTESLEAYW